MMPTFGTLDNNTLYIILWSNMFMYMYMNIHVWYMYVETKGLIDRRYVHVAHMLCVEASK